MAQFDGLTVGKNIKKIISKDPELGKIFNKKIFPSLTTLKTTFPYLTYKRNSLEPFYSKDGLYQDIVSVQLTVCSDNYEESLELISKLRKLIEFKSFPEYNIDQIYLEGAYESRTDQTFEQQINVKIIFI